MTEREEGYMQQHLCECMIDVANEKTNVSTGARKTLFRGPKSSCSRRSTAIRRSTTFARLRSGSRETPSREKERMSLVYGRDIVESVYAGKSFHMEWFMPGWPINPQKASKKLASGPPQAGAERKPDDDDALDARI